jgi:hypothetical protein
VHDVVSSAPNLILYLPVECVTCFVTVRCVVTWQLQSVSIVGSLLCLCVFGSAGYWSFCSSAVVAGDDLKDLRL